MSIKFELLPLLTLDENGTKGTLYCKLLVKDVREQLAMFEKEVATYGELVRDTDYLLMDLQSSLYLEDAIALRDKLDEVILMNTFSTKKGR